MKMNDTVARIVEIMFQDVEMNEETAAIRDEVMNNCQERYTDLVDSGVAEDDAVAAVIESLKGMEDVLEPYKRNAHRHMEDMEDMDDEESGEREMIFAAGEVHKIDLTLVNEDVTLEASGDNDYHVKWDAEDNPLVQATQENGVLKIERRPGDAVRMGGDGKVEYHHKDAASDFVRTENGSITIDMENIGRTLRSVGERLKTVFYTNGNLKINVGFGDSGVTIQVPENAIPHVKLLTTSGDIDVQDVALTDLSITSTSGDIDVDLDEDQALSQVDIRTTSGDIEVSAYAGTMMISSTSGDVEVEGRVENLTANTISGDIDVRADVVSMTFKAVSGDVDMEFDSDELRTVNGSTISGDIDIDLPSGLGCMNIHTQTRSGDVTTRCHTNGYGPTVNGSVTSMSGDITIS